VTTPCETPGCSRPATSVSADGARCDPCAAAKRRRAEELLNYQRCVHFARVPDWLHTFGGPEGRRRWLADNARFYNEAPIRRPPWRRTRSPAEARAAAARAYARIRRSARSEYRCGHGHVCFTTQVVVGTSFRRGDFVDHLGPPSCDRQDSCRDYLATGDLVAAQVDRPC